MFVLDYDSLDLQISKGPEGSYNLYTASILENGDIKATRNFELRRDLKLIQMLDRIEEKVVIPRPQPEETTHIEFGKILYDAVFSGELGGYFNKRFNEVQDKNCGLRVSMQFSDDVPEIAALPWEYLHNGKDFLITRRNILLSRLPVGVKKTESQPLDSILRILVVISSPDDPGISPLNTKKEQEIILEAVDKLQRDQKIKVDFTEDATFENVQDYLIEQNYHIVHFTGHGKNVEGKGYLVFETEDRKATLIDNRKLADLFSDMGIRLVVLSSCESAKGSNKEAFSDVASTLSKRKIPAVVAMQYSVLDDVAIKFAHTFYRTIANEKSVDVALKEARIAIKNSEKSNGFDFGTPVMYLSDSNCIQVKDSKREPTEFKIKPTLLLDLPRMNKGFVARRKELRILEKCFKYDVKRAAIIHGFGGIGKTALATRFEQKMNEYFDGTFGMKCTSTTRPENILTKLNDFLIMNGRSELSQVLNSQVSLEIKTSVLVGILNQLRFLIILDNFGDCLDVDRKEIENPDLKVFVQYLLNTTISNTKFIITTRYDFDPMESKLSESIEHISLPELHFPQTNWLMNNYTELADLDISKKKKIYNVIGGHPWTVAKFAKNASVQGVDSLMLDLKPLKKELIDFTLLEKSFSKLDSGVKKLLLYASIYEEAVPVEALSWIIGDEKDESPAIGEPLQKLIQYGLISKEEVYGQIVYTEHTIVRNFAHEEMKEEGLDKKKLLIRAARYYENFSSTSKNIWDILRARNYYYQAEEWARAFRIVISTVDALIRWGYIELSMNLLNESIKTTSDENKMLAEVSRAVIFHRLGDVETAYKAYKNAKDICENVGNKGGASLILYQIGLIHEHKGEYEKAINLYNQVLENQKETENKDIIVGALYQLGNIHYKKKNYEEAIEKYYQSLEIFEELRDKNGISEVFHSLGMVHQDQGDYEEAAERYSQSLEIAEEMGNKYGISVTMLQIGTLNYIQGKYDKASEMYVKSLKIKKAIGDKRGTAITLYQLGMVHYQEGNYREAVSMYTQSLEIRKELGNKIELTDVLYQLGEANFKQGDYEGAIDNYNKSLEIKKELKDSNGVATTLDRIGNIHFLHGNYEEAGRIYIQSLNAFEELGNKEKIAGTLHQLGNVYYIQGDLQEAVKIYTQVLKIFEELGDKSGIAVTSDQLGIIYQDQGNYEKAIRIYNQFLKNAEKMENKDIIIEALYKIAEIYYLQHKYEEAIRKYNRALEIAEEIENKFRIGSTLYKLANIYYLQYKYEEAIKKYNESMEIAEEVKNKYGIAAALCQLGMIAQDQGNYKEALKKYNHSLKIFNELGDKSKIAGIMHQLGMVQQYQGNYEEAVKKYNYSLKIKEELGDKSGIGITLGQLGRIYEEKGDYELALKNYYTALEIFEEINSPNRGIAQNLIAELQGKKGRAV